MDCLMEMKIRNLKATTTLMDYDSVMMTVMLIH
jgi:hypothetical protein